LLEVYPFVCIQIDRRTRSTHCRAERAAPTKEDIVRKTIAAGVVAGFALAAGFIAPATASTADNATLYVFHGIPDTPVDVWVNGEVAVPDFQPGTFAGPLELPAGDYEVVLTAPDAAITEVALGPVTLPLEAGMNYTAAAYLDASGAGTAKLFTNDVAATNAGEGRLTVRHTAAAPEVDILAGGSPVLTNVANGAEGTLNLPVGTVEASVAATGTTEPVLGPAPVDVQDGVLTIAYAWGSLEGESLALATQNITVGHTTPGGVNSGTAGYAAERDAMMQSVWIIGFALAAAVASVAVVAARRTRAAKIDS
jgi:hypothetical protein